MSVRDILQSAAGAGVDKLYVEDVFSIYLYTGNGSTQTITNGIDLAGNGGLVWCKGRSSAGGHAWFDNVRGLPLWLNSNTTGIATNSAGISTFNSDGFYLGGTSFNGSGLTVVSWTFRKAPKFFDVVTYTGTGSARTVSHSLGSVPGCIIVKRTDTTGAWQVYHTSNGAGAYQELNTTAARVTSNTDRWNNTSPTSTVFTVGTDASVNASGGTYVAYLFANNAGGFGDSGTDNIISCGSYTGNGLTPQGPIINLGWEPQYLLVKRADSTSDWMIIDAMRSFAVVSYDSPTTYEGNDALLFANTTAAESYGTTTATQRLDPTPTGFRPTSADASVNASGGTYIYIAIRRGPMKTPTLGTEVYNSEYKTTTGAAVVTTGWPVDMALGRRVNTLYGPYLLLRAFNRAYYLLPAGTSSISQWGSTSDFATFDNNTSLSTTAISASASYQTMLSGFRRAPNFFDVITWRGTEAALTVNHNLGQTPKIAIIKVADRSGFAYYFFMDALTGGNLWNQNNSTWIYTKSAYISSMTSTTISLTSASATNYSGGTCMALLFGDCPGVSKIGTYTGTGTGSVNQINCGFSSGARFIMLRRTDSTGSWYFYDSNRGISASNDPYFFYTETTAETTTTDWVDPYSPGFELTTNSGNAVNFSGATYMFWAIS